MDYQQGLNRIAQINGLIKRLGDQITTGDRDKTGLRFAFRTIENSSWRSAVISFDACHGYYGNGSCSNDMSPELAQAVVAALNTEEVKAHIVQYVEKLLTTEKNKIASEIEAAAKTVIDIVRTSQKQTAPSEEVK